MVGEGNFAAERQRLDAIEVQREAILHEMANIRRAEVVAALPDSTIIDMLDMAYIRVNEQDPEHVGATEIARGIMRQRLECGHSVPVADAEQLLHYTKWYDWTPGPQPLKHAFGVLALRYFPSYDTAETEPTAA